MHRALALVSLVVLAACSGSSSSLPAGDDGSGAGSSGGDGSGAADAGGKEDEQVGPRGAFKSYVILGDSISDRGGSGPYFYDLVGDDLKAKLGDVEVVKNSKSGAVSAGLPGQVSGLPKELPGPVAVSVTIGGNDMQTVAYEILNGSDAPARAKFAENLTKAYDELTQEGRFGAGVKVTVFHATIYDPSDGEGNYAEAGCPGYLRLLPKQPTKTFWDNWNKAGADAIAKYGDAIVTVDIRTKFQGNGIGKLKAGTSWYAPDCIHPNTTGHEELRKLFFASIAP
ncbi:MAG: SGNH/GDSL hydrolase family protein [Labilithrix sp.]|nr:SGNH/GDSL hydrolase family protein [Labilithrix sp.]MBX3220468.1 SGNH/GDSL hydrolase family protein [Labilithrix sp.]